MNKKNIAKAIVFVLIACSIIFLGVKYLPRTDWYKNVTADKGGNITAVELAKLYQENSIKADSLYTNKLIEIEGKVAAIVIENDIQIVNLATQDSLVFVSVSLKPKQPIIKINETVLVKGTCAGILTDVQINEAEIIKK